MKRFPPPWVLILFHSFEVIVTREHEFSDALSNRMSFRGFTALHYAVLIDDIHVVKALLEAGADPTIKSSAGYLPVDFAQHSPVMKDVLVKASTEVLSSCVTCVLYSMYFVGFCSSYNLMLSAVAVWKHQCIMTFVFCFFSLVYFYLKFSHFGVPRQCC